jgi:MtrB/PioB family decaheme-associated outer membrane protein
MTTRNALRYLALATTCLAPLAARADDPPAALVPFPTTHGEIEVDLGGIMGNNPNQAGRYNGFNTTGVFGGIGELDIYARAPWNSGDVRFIELNGTNLMYRAGDHLGSGLNSDNSWASSIHNSLGNSASLELRAGDQGIWQIGLNYDAITYTGNVIDSLYTVNNGGIGTLNNGLRPWGGATTTRAGTTSFTVPQLNATGAMLPSQTGTRRDLFGGNFKTHWDDWTFKGAISHEHKEGSMEESFYGPWGGTAFGLPINYDTDRFDLSAAYTTRHLQALLQYTFSHFNDNLSFVNLPYPTSNSAAPFQRSAAYSTPPSNDAHYLTFMVATDVVPLTHINVNGRVGIEVQDDTFAPNTADPSPSGAGLNTLNSLGQGTTAASPNMMADVYQLKVSASSRPIQNVDTRVYYGLDGRDVTVNQYKVYAGGTGGGATDAAAAAAVGSTQFFVVPQNWLKQNVGFEVGYRVLPEQDTKVTVGYRLDSIDRSNAQVGRSWTNTGTVALTSAFGTQLNGKLSFDYVNRSGSLSYITPWQNLTGAPDPTFSGAYYQAPMTSQAVTLRADYSPTEKVSASLYVKFKNENFNYPAATLAGTDPGTVLPLSGTGQGIRQDYSLSVGPDINYRPTSDLNLHFFYTYEQLFYDNLGNGQCSVAPVTALCTGTAGFFRNTDTSSTHTVGISGEWTVNEKLKLRAEYTMSYGTVMFGEFDGVFVPVVTQSFQNLTNYPDINSLMNNVRFTATYQLRPNIELIGQGVYTSFRNNDWNDTANAVQGAGTSAISFLTPGYAAPNYSVVALLAGVKFRF